MHTWYWPNFHKCYSILRFLRWHVCVCGNTIAPEWRLLAVTLIGMFCVVSDVPSHIVQYHTASTSCKDANACEIMFILPTRKAFDVRLEIWKSKITWKHKLEAILYIIPNDLVVLEVALRDLNHIAAEAFNLIALSFSTITVAFSVTCARNPL